MSQPREYRAAAIHVVLRDGAVDAWLQGIESTLPASVPAKWTTWNLDPATVLTEYTKRCAAAARQHPEMSPEQAEKAALLAWVRDMELVSRDAE